MQIFGYLNLFFEKKTGVAVRKKPTPIF